MSFLLLMRCWLFFRHCSRSEVTLHRGRVIVKSEAPVTQSFALPAGLVEIQLPENGFVAIHWRNTVPPAAMNQHNPTRERMSIVL